jgi:hypothetical protein
VYIKLVVLLRNYVTMMHGQQNIKNGWATIVVVGRLRVKVHQNTRRQFLSCCLQFIIFYPFHYSTLCSLSLWKVVLQTTNNNRPNLLVCCRWLRNAFNRWAPTTGGSLTYNTLLKTIFLWCCISIIFQFVCTFTKMHWLRALVLQESW